MSVPVPQAPGLLNRGIGRFARPIGNGARTLAVLSTLSPVERPSRPARSKGGREHIIPKRDRKNKAVRRSEVLLPSLPGAATGSLPRADCAAPAVAAAEGLR